LRHTEHGDILPRLTDPEIWAAQPQGPTAALSPGTFGHGSAYGTQAWIDPAKQVIYVLMVQRSDFPNSDGSDVRNVFQVKAAEAMGR